MRLAAVAVLLACSLTVAADPRSHYLIHCMGCHLVDGSGQPPDVPVFGDTTRLMATTEAGREYLVQVPGAAQAPLDDKALAAVINWLLNEYTSGEAFAPFTADEVTRHRATTLTDPLKARQAVLGQSLSP